MNRPAWDLSPRVFDLPGVAWSVVVSDVASRQVVFSLQPDTELKTASVGKVFLLIELARQLQEGTISPTERLTWRPEEWLMDSGIWYLLDQRMLSVADLGVLVGAFSDNLATNVLVRRLGIETVQVTTRRLGFTRSKLVDRVRSQRTAADPPTLSVGTAGELADLMSRLSAGQVISPGVSERVINWLEANVDLSMVASAFNLDPLAHDLEDRGVLLFNKTGTISTARIDIGAVEGDDGTVAYAALANWSPDTDPRDEVMAVMRTLGHAIRQYVHGDD